MKNTDTHSTINILKQILSQHVRHETLVSDNGTQFTSESFRYFCKSSCITHVSAPPYHPQFNGQAGRFVGIFKRVQLKAKGEETITRGGTKYISPLVSDNTKWHSKEWHSWDKRFAPH